MAIGSAAPESVSCAVATKKVSTEKGDDGRNVTGNGRVLLLYDFVLEHAQRLPLTKSWLYGVSGWVSWFGPSILFCFATTALA